MSIFFKKLLFIILLCFYSNISNAIEAGNSGQSTASENNTEYLFVQTAAAGELTYEIKSLSYKLTLRKVDPWVTYFSIAPKREGGLKTVPELVKLVNKEITMKYPKGLNAGLTLFEPHKDQPTHYALTIKDPVYNQKMHTIVYSASIIAGGKVKPLVSIMRFKKAALFIDDMSNASGGAGF